MALGAITYARREYTKDSGFRVTAHWKGLCADIRAK